MMFMPDKQAAYGEARRVLRPKGRLIFTAWDRLEANPLMDIVDMTLAAMFPEKPPHILARTPCGYYVKARFERELGEGGFTSVGIEEIQREADVSSAGAPAVELC